MNIVDTSNTTNRISSHGIPLSEPRKLWLDILRGLTVLSMVTYHFTWDLVHVAELPISWFYELPGVIWQQSICWSFILISGYSISHSLRRKESTMQIQSQSAVPSRKSSAATSASRSIVQSGKASASSSSSRLVVQSSVIRGLRLIGFGVLITVASFFILPLQPIYFGVLTLLGSSVVLTALFYPILRRVNPLLGTILCFLLFALTYGLGQGFIGFFWVPLANLPSVLYRNFTTAYFGFPFPGFRSADYYPLFPWLLLFLTGFYLQRAIARKTLASTSRTALHSDIGRAQCPNPDIVGLQHLNQDKKRPTQGILGAILLIPAWIGRNALWIYLLHQPMILLGFLGLGKIR